MTREWDHWVATAPAGQGLKEHVATEFNHKWRRDVRVNGHDCGGTVHGCLSSMGTIDLYHIDTRAGLGALVSLVKEIEAKHPAVKLKPFHETIMDAISRCPAYPEVNEMLNLMILIESTRIPANHDSIMEAIDSYWDHPSSGHWHREISLVRASLMEQKKKVAKHKEDSFWESYKEKIVSKHFSDQEIKVLFSLLKQVQKQQAVELMKGFRPHLLNDERVAQKEDGLFFDFGEE